ncbi:MAG TPA: SDR family oxidoreductase [Streptosporangiaceae bacterium]|nr:SDR family oxidoreductase [Streptosporangiaceae bacterium]
MAALAPAPGAAGRTALVTGAGNGLGRAIALALGRAGARLVLAGRTRASLAGTAGLLSGGRDAVVRVADVGDPGQVAALAESLAAEPVSILVNNAGIAGVVKPLTEIEPAEWDEVFRINVTGVYLMCRAFLPGMIAAGTGDVINIASVSGKRPLARRTPYTASKMAVIGLTRTLAAEVGASGVRVNSLSPGYVVGARMARNFRIESEATGQPVEDVQARFAARGALNRMITEDEVGEAVLAMLALTAMTGADLDLSAGMVAP